MKLSNRLRTLKKGDVAELWGPWNQKQRQQSPMGLLLCRPPENQGHLPGEVAPLASRI